MKISVLTNTFRPGGFDVVSAALAAQVDAPPFEWIVVDELHHWRAPAIAATLWSLSFPVKHLPTERSLFPIASTMRAGNTGIRAASGELIVHLCDHAIPDPDFLAKCWAAYQADPKTIIVPSYRARSVPAECWRSAPASMWDLIRKLERDTFDERRLWSMLKPGWALSPVTDTTWQHLGGIDPGTTLDEWSVHYKTDAVPRTAYLEVNGWDEEYDGVYAYGDVDMTLRLRCAGWKPVKLDACVDIIDSHGAPTKRHPEAAYRDYDAPRLLKRTFESVKSGKYRCDFGLTVTPDGEKRSLSYISKHGIIFTGDFASDKANKAQILTIVRPWLPEGRTTVWMLPADAFVWEHLVPPVLRLTKTDTACLDDAKLTCEPSPLVRTVLIDHLNGVPVASAPSGRRYILTGSEADANELIDFANSHGWPCLVEKRGEVCCVMAVKP